MSTQVELRRLLARFHPPRILPLEPVDEHHDERPMTAADQLAHNLGDPNGRKERRGIPLAGGNGGLDERRDPLLEVLAREGQAERRRMPSDAD